MTLREAIAHVEAFMDGETQSGRLDEDTVEAMDMILARVSLEADLDPMENEGDGERIG